MLYLLYIYFLIQMIWSSIYWSFNADLRWARGRGEKKKPDRDF